MLTRENEWLTYVCYEYRQTIFREYRRYFACEAQDKCYNVSAKQGLKSPPAAAAPESCRILAYCGCLYMVQDVHSTGCLYRTG